MLGDAVGQSLVVGVSDVSTTPEGEGGGEGATMEQLDNTKQVHPVHAHPRQVISIYAHAYINVCVCEYMLHVVLFGKNVQNEDVCARACVRASVCVHSHTAQAYIQT